VWEDKDGWPEQWSLTGQKQPPEAVYEKKVYSQYQSIRLKHLATFPRLRSHKCTSRVASATPGPSDS